MYIYIYIYIRIHIHIHIHMIHMHVSAFAGRSLLPLFPETLTKGDEVLHLQLQQKPALISSLDVRSDAVASQHLEDKALGSPKQARNTR